MIFLSSKEKLKCEEWFQRRTLACFEEWTSFFREKKNKRIKISSEITIKYSISENILHPFGGSFFVEKFLEKKTQKISERENKKKNQIQWRLDNQEWIEFPVEENEEKNDELKSIKTVNFQKKRNTKSKTTTKSDKNVIYFLHSQCEYTVRTREDQMIEKTKEKLSLQFIECSSRTRSTGRLFEYFHFSLVYFAFLSFNSFSFQKRYRLVEHYQWYETKWSSNSLYLQKECGGEAELVNEKRNKLSGNKFYFVKWRRKRKFNGFCLPYVAILQHIHFNSHFISFHFRLLFCRHSFSTLFHSWFWYRSS